MKKSIMIVFLTLITILTGCQSNKEDQMKMYKEDFLGAFDTVHTFIAYASSQETFDHYVKRYKEESTRLHNLYTTFDDVKGVNNIKTINDKAGIEPVVVAPEIIQLLEKAIEWNKTVSSSVNIAFGPVLKIWHEYREDAIDNPSTANAPTYQELDVANHCTDINKIKIDKENSSVYLEESCMSLDVGSIAKGYAVEEIAVILENEGLQSAAISAGGNVRVIGRRPVAKTDNTSDLPACKEQFCIGLTPPIFGVEALDANNPYLKYQNKLIGKVVAENLSIVTSGDYQRYYVANEVVYHHIIDPKTLMPANHYRAVTIITPDSGFADFMSSAVYLLSYEDGLKLVESIDKLEAVWLMNDGTIHYSSGIIEGVNYHSYENE